MNLNQNTNNLDEFDLFKLYIPELDKVARSQIRVKGKYLLQEVNKILTDLANKGFKITPISEEISVKLNCHRSTVLKMFTGKNKWISIAVLTEILEMYKKLRQLSIDETDRIKYCMQNAFEYFMASNKKPEYCKVVLSLNTTFAKIIGAYQADGWMIKQFCGEGCTYKILIVDHYKANLNAFSDWVYEVFGLKPLVKKARNADAWIVQVSSKVIGRYFEVFVGFTKGIKSHLPMPTLIKNASLDIRRNYLCGHLTFEGSVELSQIVSLGIKSEMLRDDIFSTLKELNIKSKKEDRNGVYYIRSGSMHAGDLTKWMNIFEIYSHKWYKLKDFRDGFCQIPNNKNQAIESLDTIYGEHARFSMPFAKITRRLIFKTETDRHLLARELGIGVTTLQSYLKILEISHIIKRRVKGHKLLIEYNPNLSQWRIPNRNIESSPIVNSVPSNHCV